MTLFRYHWSRPETIRCLAYHVTLGPFSPKLSSFSAGPKVKGNILELTSLQSCLSNSHLCQLALQTSQTSFFLSYSFHLFPNMLTHIAHITSYHTLMNGHPCQYLMYLAFLGSCFASSAPESSPSHLHGYVLKGCRK